MCVCLVGVCVLTVVCDNFIDVGVTAITAIALEVFRNVISFFYNFLWREIEMMMPELRVKRVKESATRSVTAVFEGNNHSKQSKMGINRGHTTYCTYVRTLSH